jgi:hypothetical protein
VRARLGATPGGTAMPAILLFIIYNRSPLV